MVSGYGDAVLIADGTLAPNPEPLVRVSDPGRSMRNDCWT